MMKPKVIKTDADYEMALAHLETLMDAKPGTPQEEDLELFAVLIENYEREKFPIGLPDPIEAIKFRMEQQGLSRKDLEPFIGSQSKVSEVLNHKRPLSVAMIRALHKGLDIPAEVLLQEEGGQLASPRFDYHKYPFKEMFNGGYFKSFNGTLSDAKEYAEELLASLFSTFEGQVFQRAHCRDSSNGQMDEYALEAWQARTLELASEQEAPPYAAESFTQEDMRYIVRLSAFEEGPRLAREYLQSRGIPLVLLDHLPHTYLDGACFKSPSGRPIVGITLRHDRLDNFWFTLIHELAHVHLHLENGNIAFFDETETGVQESHDPLEREANALASEVLIQKVTWEKWRRITGNMTSKDDIRAFARDLGISPAIVAGRLRFETGEYKNFTQLLGSKTVRKMLQNN
jgi:HTH-type transcriptional regulator/antitoxin HigA